jgi:pimeloyl-ACP methyl ester carboxylesterase
VNGLDRRLTDKTLGGRQFWADVAFFHDWRIQQNVLTEHFRLLDGDDYRHAWGSRDECELTLQTIRDSRKLPPMSGEAVILLHGIVRSSKSMRPLQRHLRLEHEGWRTFSFGYASTQVDIVRSAEYLHSVVQSLEGIERIHLVAHSMGGLIARAYLARHEDPRIGRLVMIATPSLGAELADRFHRNFVYRAVFGPAGQQLTQDAEGFVATLPTPEIEFGVIAGGRGDGQGYNPLVPGDDDGTVSVACTRLPGAADFVVVDRLHTFLVSAPETRDYTLRFLKQGRFREEGDAQPIPTLDQTIGAADKP